MTGFGEAQSHGPEVSCSVTIRSVNNRFLKIAINLPESHATLERELEKAVRNRLHRGTVSVFVRIDRPGRPCPQRLNLDVLNYYLSQLETVTAVDASVVSGLLQLPGVLEDGAAPEQVEADRPWVRTALESALETLDQMRRDEGSAMADELAECARAAAALIEDVARLAPENVRSYRERLHQRLSTLLAEHGIAITPTELIREVALFADRCDITEEISRLRSHLAQFEQTLRARESAGRKLDFLAQEMNRETNTIGAKANNAVIAQWVVDLKTLVERIREIIQNVE
jgi:uncharacterized protein (TIGR00255 family)